MKKKKHDNFINTMLFIILVAVSLIFGNIILSHDGNEIEKHMILMEITDKRESTNSIHIKSYYKSNYYFIMDDGTKFEVSEAVYDKYNIGDDIFINRYDEYSLDKKGNRILVDSTYEWKGK